MISRRSFTLASTLFAISPSVAFAKTINRFSQGEDQLALQGYDTTAYFTSGEPVEGAEALVVEWKGAKWQFVTAEDAETFRANPDAYAPQFGGYCTRAMSLQQEVPGDPEVWRLHNGKLYVFFASRGGRAFDRGPDEMIELAQAHWDTLDFVE